MGLLVVKTLMRDVQIMWQLVVYLEMTSISNSQKYHYLLSYILVFALDT